MNYKAENHSKGNVNFLINHANEKYMVISNEDMEMLINKLEVEFTNDSPFMTHVVFKGEFLQIESYHDNTPSNQSEIKQRLEDWEVCGYENAYVF